MGTISEKPGEPVLSVLGNYLGHLSTPLSLCLSACVSLGSTPVLSLRLLVLLLSAPPGPTLALKSHQHTPKSHRSTDGPRAQGSTFSLLQQLSFGPTAHVPLAITPTGYPSRGELWVRVAFWGHRVQSQSLPRPPASLGISGSSSCGWLGLQDPSVRGQAEPSPPTHLVLLSS